MRRLSRLVELLHPEVEHVGPEHLTGNDNRQDYNPKKWKSGENDYRSKDRGNYQVNEWNVEHNGSPLLLLLFDDAEDETHGINSRNDGRNEGLKLSSS